ncbi:hypothetical protein V5O48_013355 [Marasmius crinis-equi]|uniref:Uncharacterized protein n=1 Tax=Marasmius crinis-equi TaxID=585013 RepID=A0ABR3F0B3_9AGAR
MSPVFLPPSAHLTVPYSVMVRVLSQFFAADPPLVKGATFENLTKERPGGWEIPGQKATVDDVVNTELEVEVFAKIRRILRYLPLNIFKMAPDIEMSGSGPRTEEDELIRAILHRR